MTLDRILSQSTQRALVFGLVLALDLIVLASFVSLAWRAFS